MALLAVEGLESGYGTTVVCRDINLSVAEEEIVCVLGRNGVGKTTLMRSLIGSLPILRGRVHFDGTELAGRADHERARRGVGYVPQGRMVFARLTVAENLLSGTFVGTGRLGQIDGDVFEYFPVLKRRLRQAAGTLSGGEQQMLALARVLCGRPRLLLLDEPSEGIQPSIVAEIAAILRRLRHERKLALLVVEQNLKFAAAIADRGYVMEKGSIVAAGNINELLQDAVVQQHLVLGSAE